MFRLTSCIVMALVVLVLTQGSRAAVFYYDCDMSGPNESPANASPGTGVGFVVYDDVAHTLYVECSFSGLQGTTTASHIHSATAAPFGTTAGVATTTPTFAGFPLGVTAGSYINTLDLTLASSYNPSFVSANGGTTASAEAALMAGINANKAYWNIHSSVVGSGEIRGFLVAVPEPSSLALLGVASLLAVRRRAR